MSFKKIESRDLPDIQSVGHVYVHDKTGAKVLWLKNKDRNRAFTIAFKTLPVSDNGITHIIEHSVLNGSKKYPSKEPFVELIKGSMNTFLNAMTFADKTIYPVASTNEKDFFNLMDVYLDAVFHPNFYHDPQILKQEGWHYHLPSAEDDLTYKGVVYSEMKGALGAPEQQIYNLVSNRLYAGSAYAYISGGDPKSIVGLSQEEFVAYHKKHYHPSNSLTIVYGDLEEEAIFKELSEYFDEFEARDAETLTCHCAVDQVTTVKDSYSISEGEDLAEKTYLGQSFHIGENLGMEELMAFNVLEEILLGSNQAPLKKALLQAGIGGDVYGGVTPYGLPSAFSVVAKYAEAEQLVDFTQVVENSLKNLAEEGIDKEAVEAALNKITFQLKELAISESEPRGVIYAMNALDSWLYSDEAMEHLEFSKYLDKVREKAAKGYFEELIQTRLLKNPHQLVFCLSPEAGKNDEKERALAERLAHYKASLTEEEVKALVDETQALLKRQETPDDPEDLAKIPTLDREDLDPELEELPLEVDSLYGDQSYYFAEQFTSGIDYVSLRLDVTDLPYESLQDLTFLSSLLGELATSHYEADQLQQAMDLKTGGISAFVKPYSTADGKIKVDFRVAGKALANFGDDLIKLMKEILLYTQLTDKNLIKNLAQASLSEFEGRLNYSANALALQRAISRKDRLEQVNEWISGISYYQYLQNLVDHLTEDKLNELQELLTRLANKERFGASYIGDKERAKLWKERLLKAFEGLKAEKLVHGLNLPAIKEQKEAFVCSQDVNYVAIGHQASDLLPYSGSACVLMNIASFAYLWNRVRVQGGAYGANYSHSYQGEWGMSSYRDPNISRTLEAYEALADYLEHLELDDKEVLKAIIGTMSGLDRPLSGSTKGALAIQRYISGVSQKDLLRLRKEVLNTRIEDLRALAPAIRQLSTDAALAVVGNKAKIEEVKDQFEAIYELN
ncbi:peptidase M16 [Atopobacter sp. AH10]|uniref:insulinase family protein n=1 Tax=Atopobacter sp. AH10 TaxID=2315861 RepID=UPI000EF25831|nr:insulinase family protein [Atopobacter sp. AH10]RLK64183.1 peptidase M16 [Atopobacter sp. AH10]